VTVTEVPGACAMCGQVGFIRWTTIHADPKTVESLGLPKPDGPVDLRVCHGCYLQGMSNILGQRGLPKVVPGAQLALPLETVKP